MFVKALHTSCLAVAVTRSGCLRFISQSSVSQIASSRLRDARASEPSSRLLAFGEPAKHKRHHFMSGSFGMLGVKTATCNPNTCLDGFSSA